LGLHFTYCRPDKSTLKQGDLVARNSDVDEMLREVHPHYFRKAGDYRYLLVLTQTCDLVRREGECATRYISLAAVRPFELALRRESNAHFG